jgi:hypothetical protein
LSTFSAPTTMPSPGTWRMSTRNFGLTMMLQWSLSAPARASQKTRLEHPKPNRTSGYSRPQMGGRNAPRRLHRTRASGRQARVRQCHERRASPSSYTGAQQAFGLPHERSRLGRPLCGGWTSCEAPIPQ